jgi:hypothetical protein
MMRDDQAVCGEIKTLIAFEVSGVASKDTLGGLRGEFMWRGGGNVRITCTTEDTKCSDEGADPKRAT